MEKSELVYIATCLADLCDRKGIDLQTFSDATLPFSTKIAFSYLPLENAALEVAKFAERRNQIPYLIQSVRRRFPEDVKFFEIAHSHGVSPNDTISYTARRPRRNVPHTYGELIPAGLAIASLAIILTVIINRSAFDFVILLVFGIILLVAYRTWAVLGSGGDAPDSIQRHQYDAFRNGLAAGNSIQRTYRSLAIHFISWQLQFFGDRYSKPNQLIAKFLGVTTETPLWTAASFDRCVLIAAIYPATCIIFFWALSGSVQKVQESLHLSVLPPWHRSVVAVALIFQFFAIRRLLNTSSWLSAAWAIAGGNLSISLAVVGAGLPEVALIFFVAGIGAASLGLLLDRLKVPFIAFNRSVSGAGALAGVVVGAGTFAWLGQYSQAFGGAGGGLIAVAVAGLLTYLSSKVSATIYHAYLLICISIAIPILCLIFAALFSVSSTWGKAGPMILYMGFLPVLNSVFDWISVGITRALMWRGIQRRAWWPLYYSLIDAAIAVVLIFLLSACLIISVLVFNCAANCACVGNDVQLDVAGLLYGIQSHPLDSGFWWAYALVGTTLLPSITNLMIGGASTTSGIPWLSNILLDSMPKDNSPPIHDRIWMALLWASNRVLGGMVGIIVQVTLLVGLLVYILPPVGIELLDFLETLETEHGVENLLWLVRSLRGCTAAS